MGQEDLLKFIQDSPSPFHAVSSMIKKLESAAYQKLELSHIWNLKIPGNYYLSLEDSTLIAFSMSENPLSKGFKMLGAHSDSPCLKLRANPLKTNGSYLQALVEIYGGVLLSTWFDRDLSLAGKVVGQTENGEIKAVLVDLKDKIANLPSLAIHLDRLVNEQRSIQAEKEIAPLLGMIQNQLIDPHTCFEQRLLKNSSLSKLLSFELCFYDTQTPSFVGLDQEYIASARLDNLVSCFALLEAFLNSKSTQNRLLVCYNHEEVGSGSRVGAQGSLLETVLKRLVKTHEEYSCMIANSFFISADNAHGLHPNYPEKYQSAHAPILNQGVALKLNQNQRYASSAEGLGYLKHLAQRASIPLQSYMARSDMPCGSTIGPMVSAQLGVATVDLGVPSLAMHSIREMVGKKDVRDLIQLIIAFLG